MTKVLVKETLVLSTAEFLAKSDEYALDSIAPYLEEARRLHAGNETDSEDIATTIQLHELMAQNNEVGALSFQPQRAERYTQSDANQVANATSNPRNLNYFLENGVDYRLDESQIDKAIELAAGDEPLTIALMRANVISASGFENVRLNYIYHDVLDHIWLFDFMRKHGLHERYADYLETVGDPFQGGLMSREAELLSGIGFTSRRYLADPEQYASMAASTESIIEALEEHISDYRIGDAIGLISSDSQLAEWAGFVIKDTIANLIPQRAKRGSVKKMERKATGAYVSTGEPTDLFDPKYIALIIETVNELAANKQEYIDAQVKLNFLIEGILRKFVRGGEAAGVLSLRQEVEIEQLPESQVIKLGDIGISTTYFQGSK